VDVDHRRCDVRVAHVRLHVCQRERLHGQGAEGVPQIVEAKPLESGALERGDVAPPQGGALDVVTDRIHEHEVVVARPALPAAQLVERRGRLVDEGHRAHSAGLRRALRPARKAAPHVDEVKGPVDVAPAESQQLAKPKAREGGHGEDRGVLLVGGVRREQLDLAWVQHVEVA
jgi:hypothetical protein